MDHALRLLVMLAAGLVVRHAVLRVGRAWAAGLQVHIPALCSYAAAGTLAAGARWGLGKLGVEGLLLAVMFGAVWGAVAGLMLPFARKHQDARA